MTDLINPNIRSIIHILNNWNFTYNGDYVKANLEIYITKDELNLKKNWKQNKNLVKVELLLLTKKK